MIRFNSDYTEGAHPNIMEAMLHTNFEQTPGYGEDYHCENARQMIKDICGRQDVGVHFLVGGTQTNLTFLAAVLKPYQGVISAQTGHINVHETGAIEATGHKVIAVHSDDGLLTGEMVKKVCVEHFEDETHEHMVMPGAVYISNSTEVGTIYDAATLKGLREVCDEYGLLLYMDGARLGYAMAAPGNDVTFEYLAQVCDAFYIGGTKQGALFGEALVIVNKEANRNFRYMIKQKGGMLAKGRLLGIQFEELMKDGLYMKLSHHAVSLVMKIREAALAKGWRLSAESPTNQQFFVVPNEQLKKLNEKYAFSPMGVPGETESEIRICTSWATKEENVEALIADIKAV